LSGESSAYYHGYILAEVAVHQTRAFFLDRDGHLVDNPKIGPTLRDAYWRRGNARTFKQFVRDLTGEELSAKHIARAVNRTVEDALSEARQKIERLNAIPHPSEATELGASIRVMHGNEQIASSSTGYGSLGEDFARWIDTLESAA
ncbi:MAG: peptidase M3, partial [Myxococcota bacterium]